MKLCILTVMLLLTFNCSAEENADFDRRTDYRLWDGRNLNTLFANNPELQPKYESKWEFCLPWSEYCSYCGAFSYYHRIDKDGNRKCCRCGAEWKSKNGGNYWVHNKLPY